MKSLTKVPKHTIYIFISLFLMACSPYKVKQHNPPISIPSSFYNDIKGTENIAFWWQEFGDQNLNVLIEDSIGNNLQLKQVWHRLEQAAAFVKIDGADLLPSLDLKTGATYTRLIDNDPQNNGNIAQIGTLRQNNQRYFVNLGLSYEVDLWKRIASQTESSKLQYLATAEDVKQAILVLTGQVVDAWFIVEEQQEALNLLGKQIEVGETLLELTELRFSMGRGSALDVLQQRQQLAAIKSQIPLAKSLLQTTLQQLAILQGKPPHALLTIEIGRLPILPPNPKVLEPKFLLENRPDLKSIMLQLQAAEYQIAVAVADRLPRIVLSPSYELATTKFSTFFHQEILSLVANMIAPIFDGGKRAAEVERRRAIVQEILNAFGDAYLQALLEIENALVQEKRQMEFIVELQLQVDLAEKALEESKARYINGLNDYLTVIFALQTLQNLERQMITEKRQLLTIRAQLYRAMGGSWVNDSFRKITGDKQ